MKALLVSILASLISGVLSDDPNILIIVADDMARLVGHLGPELGLEEWAQPTPNIDALAEKGVTFTTAHVCAPECKPSRTCLIYGESPVKTQVVQNADDAGNPNVADKEHMVSFLKRKGYHTVNYNRLFHTAVDNVDPKFDISYFVNVKEGGYAKRFGDDRIADTRLHGDVDFATIDEAKENHADWIGTVGILNDMKNAKKEGKKGFYAMGFTACHKPMYIPKKIMEEVPWEPGTLAYPPVPEDDFDDIPFDGQRFGKSSEENAQLMLDNPKLHKSYIRHYYGCIRLVDKLVGKLMKYVEQQDDEWLVIFTSDHGFHLIDKIRSAKFTLWSQVTQVPLVIYGGPFKGGKVISTPVSLVDLYPTLTEIIGGQPKTHTLDGKSLIGIVEGDGHKPVVTYHKWGKAVMTKNWHLIQYSWFDYEKGEYAPYNDKDYELYKTSDPWQIENVASKYPEVIERLKGYEM